jgi:para-nitrobenzyl esterase
VPQPYLQLLNDSFAYGAYSLAQSMTRSAQNAYLYLFTFTDAGKRAQLGAHHGEELFFLGESFPSDWEHNSDDDKFGMIIRTYWTQFAKTGNPNTRGAPFWPAYETPHNAGLQLGHSFALYSVSPRVQTLQKILLQTIAETERRR